MRRIKQHGGVCAVFLCWWLALQWQPTLVLPVRVAARDITTAKQLRRHRQQHPLKYAGDSAFGDPELNTLFGLYHRSANVTANSSSALRQLRRQRGQSFAQALLDSRSPGAQSYILDVRREALTYRVDVARRNCEFARRVAQQWLSEADRSLTAANRTKARSCLRERVWYNHTHGDDSDGHNDRVARYFSRMLMPASDGGGSGGQDNGNSHARIVRCVCACNMSCHCRLRGLTIRARRQMRIRAYSSCRCHCVFARIF